MDKILNTFLAGFSGKPETPVIIFYDHQPQEKATMDFPGRYESAQIIKIIEEETGNDITDTVDPACLIELAELCLEHEHKTRQETEG